MTQPQWAVKVTERNFADLYSFTRRLGYPDRPVEGEFILFTDNSDGTAEFESVSEREFAANFTWTPTATWPFKVTTTLTFHQITKF